MDQTTELRDLAKRFKRPFTAKELTEEYNLLNKYKTTPQIVGARLSRMSEYIKDSTKYNKYDDRMITYWRGRYKND